MNAEVRDYIDKQPEELRQLLQEMRAMIRAAYPQAEEGMYGSDTAAGYPVYSLNGEAAAGFAVRSKGPMLYIMDQEAVDAHRDELGKLADGKACVLYKPNKTIDAENLRRVVRACLKEAAAKRAVSAAKD